MVEFGAIEIAIGKGTLNKSHSNEITSGKITVNKLTRFKFFEVQILFTIRDVLVGQIKEVGCHYLMEKYLLTGLHIQQSSALKIQLKQKNAQASLAFFLLIVFIRDLDWIQTSNLLSRNQMRYSVAPRGLVAGANIGKNGRYPN
ncbi:MAG: hypothetical protein RLZZ529_829 [Bacteroidota bacterium]|jgi:hypothetical protein